MAMSELAEAVARYLFALDWSSRWDGAAPDQKDAYREKADAAIAAIRAAGWTVVPVEPTDEMLLAADRAPAPLWEMDNPDHVDFVLFCVRRAEWAAMLAALAGDVKP